MQFITRQQAQRIQRRLVNLYGDQAPGLLERFYMMIGRYGVGLEAPPRRGYWSENDTVLITYADIVQDRAWSRDHGVVDLSEEIVLETPLQTLRRFCSRRLRGAIRVIHILPFYPWSSDDGFSVIDYREVDSNYGSWKDVSQLGADFDLMFDLVLNHCSRGSEWFQQYVTGIAPARFYFLPTDPKTDLSSVVRPRPWPLLSRAATRDGEAWVWSTFSEDQVDLNWQNPDVFFEFLDILFLYLSYGVRILRLDAVAFLWKVIGTSCIHLPETHEIVKLFRDVLEIVAPDVILLTETNVPHAENISYFGEGDEAHMVYNFSLPPLVLHALLRNDGSHLTRWARSLPELGAGQAFLNFTASHDGIGVRPLQGILEEDELAWIVEQVEERGGRVSVKANSDGSTSPYELNITYVDALSDLQDDDRGIDRFLCSQAIALAFRGIPAIYFHSLVGTPNYQEGVEHTGQNRSINRRKWVIDELEALIDDPATRQGRIYGRYLQWLRRRLNHTAFHPDGAMEVLDLGPDLFAFVRTSPGGQEIIVCVFNLTPEKKLVPMRDLHPLLAQEDREECRDILSAQGVPAGPEAELEMRPYHAFWLAVR